MGSIILGLGTTASNLLTDQSLSKTMRYNGVLILNIALFIAEEFLVI